MLLEFTVGNFLSFKEKKTLSMETASIREHKKSNTIHTARHELLKGAVIYGANSSGKSNFVKAMSTMRRLVLKSFQKSSTDELEIIPFLLNSEYEKEPTFFEVLFIVNTVRYRYGIEVNNTSIIGEWLFETNKNSERPLFLRENDGIEVFPIYKEGRDLEEKTRENAPFLAVVDQFNGTIAKTIMQWFFNFNTISGLSHEGYKAVTFKMLESDKLKPVLQNFYNELDLGFDDVRIIKKAFDPNELSKDIPEFLLKQMASDFEGKTMVNVKTLHKKFNKDNEFEKMVEFDMRSQESSGTNKIFNISGPIFDVLTDGGVLIIDELEASLHPLLTLAVTKLFNSDVYNPHNAQLIFSTHDTNLLTYGKFRRDQVFFVEKDEFGCSDLYSLVEYKRDGKKIRNDRSFEKDYIQGNYGAIPFIGNITSLLKNQNTSNAKKELKDGKKD